MLEETQSNDKDNKPNDKDKLDIINSASLLHIRLANINNDLN